MDWSALAPLKENLAMASSMASDKSSASVHKLINARHTSCGQEQTDIGGFDQVVGVVGWLVGVEIDCGFADYRHASKFKTK